MPFLKINVWSKNSKMYKKKSLKTYYDHNKSVNDKYGKRFI